LSPMHCCSFASVPQRAYSDLPGVGAESGKVPLLGAM